MTTNDHNPHAANYGAIGAPTITNANANDGNNNPVHLSTYTAGEDAGRLATLAKEFGLSRMRAPKSQVRARVSDSLSSLNLESLKVRID